MKTVKTLQGGAAMGFSQISFSSNGSKLASVATAPDYTLSIWDWEKEKVILRNKAFSQDVFKVAFAPDDDGTITTSGVGHIKFWKMASTFTGLKLQGYLGKFGATELSDIASFVYLGQGKILSTTETGNFLLWDGGFIKCELMLKGKRPCHDGRIEVLEISDNQIYSAGEDGYIKTWDLQTVRDADVQTDDNTNLGASTQRIFEIDPLEQLHVGIGAKVKAIAKSPSDGMYFAQDSHGRLFRTEIHQELSDEIYSFPSGSLLLQVHHQTRHVLSACDDGHIRLHNYENKTLVAEKAFSGKGTLLKYLPAEIDSQQSTFIAGYHDGVIRILSHDFGSKKATTRFYLYHAFKPHSARIIDAVISTDAKAMVTLSQEKTLFFFQLGRSTSLDKTLSSKDFKIVPIGFSHIKQIPKSAFFVENSESKLKLQVLFESGECDVLHVDFDGFDNNESFEIPDSRVKVEEWSIKNVPFVPLAIDPPKEGEQAEEPPRVLRFDPKALDLIYRINETVYLASIHNWTGKHELRLVDKSGESSRLLYESEGSVTAIHHSANGNLFVGASNGSITVLDFNLEKLLTNFPRNHSQLTEPICLEIMAVHGNCHVNSISTSSDGAYILSSDAEGGFFVSKRGDIAAKKLVAEQKIVYLEASVEDIISPTHYTIHEHKLKAEKDKELQDAEAKKQAKLDKITSVRQKYLQVIEDIKEKGLTADFDRSSINIDPFLLTDIEAVTQKKLTSIEEEYAWESEKTQLQLQKLKDAFYGNIKSDTQTLTGFSGDRKITTFRSMKSSFTLAHEQENTHRATKSSVPVDMEKDSRHRHHAGQLTPIKNKHDAKRQEKAMRAAQWKALMDSKPDETFEDPTDAEAIEKAKKNMGDYKLKTSSGYVVPESERASVDGKWLQLVALENSIFNLEELFNDKVRSARQRKKDIIQYIHNANAKLESINSLLCQHGEYPLPLMAVPKENLNGILADAKDQKQPSLDEKPIPIPEGLAANYQAKCAILKHKRDLIISNSEALKNEFDAEVDALFEEKISLTCGETITLFQEWQLLKEFEKLDKVLKEKYTSKKAEKSEINDKVQDCYIKLNQKKDEIEVFIQREVDIAEEVKLAIGENNKHEPYLIKVFKRKIKRAKVFLRMLIKKITNEDGELVDEESDDDDLSDSSFNEEDDEIKEKETSFVEECPVDCDTELWKAILQFREQRLDVEEGIADIQKFIDNLKKEHEGLLKKEKIIDAGLKAVESEIQEFQFQKQQKFNELDTIVPLQPHQILYKTTKSPEVLVFDKENLERLRRRVNEIQEVLIVVNSKERQQVKADHRQLRKKHLDLLQSRKQKQDKIQGLKKKVEEAQMLKFGRLVDVEKLEKVGSNRVADDLRAKLNKITAVQTKELESWNEKIAAAKSKHLEVVKTNTDYLERMTEISKKKLQEKKNSKHLQKEKSHQHVVSEEEKARVLAQVQAQEDEIARLKDQIAFLLQK